MPLCDLSFGELCDAIAFLRALGPDAENMWEQWCRWWRSPAPRDPNRHQERHLRAFLRQTYHLPPDATTGGLPPDGIPPGLDFAGPDPQLEEAIEVVKSLQRRGHGPLWRAFAGAIRPGSDPRNQDLAILLAFPAARQSPRWPC